MAPQCTRKSGPAARGDCSCSVRATTSLPEPGSLTTSTGARDGASCSTCRITARRPVSTPINAGPMSRSCNRASAAARSASAAVRNRSSSRRACALANTVATTSPISASRRRAGGAAIGAWASSTPSPTPCACSGTSHHARSLASTTSPTPRSRSRAIGGASLTSAHANSPASIHARSRSTAGSRSSVRGRAGCTTPTTPRRNHAMVSSQPAPAPSARTTSVSTPSSVSRAAPTWSRNSSRSAAIDASRQRRPSKSTGYQTTTRHFVVFTKCRGI